MVTRTKKLSESVEEHVLRGLQKVQSSLDTNPDGKYRHARGPYLMVTGCENWKTRSLLWTQEALVILYQRAQRAHSTGDQLKVTNLSTAIGAAIIRDIQNEGGKIQDTVDNQLFIGDFFIGGLVAEDLIEVTRRPGSVTSPYVVELLHVRMPEVLLRATATSKPKSITSLMDNNGYPYIKRWGGKDRIKEFEKMVADQVPHIQALDRLRQQSWCVNQDVLKVVLQSTSLLITKEVVLVDSEKKPQRVSLDEVHKRKYSKYRWYKKDLAEGEEYAPFLGNADPVIQQIRSRNVEVCLTLEKAVEVAKLDTFYQEYSCDWRGRMYCNESFFQYQGGDVARGLFLFGEGKKYDKTGLYYLKIHVANCYAVSLDVKTLPLYLKSRDEYIKAAEESQIPTVGLDKLTLDDRALWVDNNPEIVSQTTALDLKADSPVLFLAACIELQNALKDPEYVGRLPIPLDGSNNGWQHLARISMDAEAGALVSLTDSVLQKDFYVAVAKEILKHHREYFESKGMTEMKHIRKWLKRAVMVRAYSAGWEKILDILWKDAQTEGFHTKFKITKSECSNVSHWVIDAIKVVCNGPLNLTTLLQSIAAYETRSGSRYNGMRWVTASGFPVYYSEPMLVDRYIKATIPNCARINHVVKAQQFKGIKQEDGTYLTTNEVVLDINAYASGIAPNYVHSNDAAHLALTASAFKGSFGAVHDSFATHANDIPDLNTAIREKFSEMYEGYGDVALDEKGTPTKTGYELLINSLADSGIWEYSKTNKRGTKTVCFKDCIPRYTSDNRLDTTAVLTSKYFFS